MDSEKPKHLLLQDIIDGMYDGDKKFCHKHIIILSSGKNIELTEDEFLELKNEFKETVYVPGRTPCYPEYPYPTWYSENKF